MKNKINCSNCLTPLFKKDAHKEGDEYFCDICYANTQNPTGTKKTKGQLAEEFAKAKGWPINNIWLVAPAGVGKTNLK